MYKIEAFWDGEAEVWFATSDDVLGLATEAQSLESLTHKLRILNKQITDNYQGEICFEIVSHSFRNYKKSL